MQSFALIQLQTDSDFHACNASGLPRPSSWPNGRGEEGVNVGFGEADNLGREFDEGQAALLHQVVNRAHAYVQAPRNLRLGFVVLRCGEFCWFRVHARSFIFDFWRAFCPTIARRRCITNTK